MATRGRVAQLGERLVRNEEAGGSNPLSSTIVSITYATFVTTCSSPGSPTELGSVNPSPIRSAQSRRNCRSPSSFTAIFLPSISLSNSATRAHFMPRTVLAASATAAFARCRPWPPHYTGETSTADSAAALSFEALLLHNQTLFFAEYNRFAACPSSVPKSL